MSIADKRHESSSLCVPNERIKGLESTRTLVCVCLSVWLSQVRVGVRLFAFLPSVSSIKATVCPGHRYTSLPQTIPSTVFVSPIVHSSPYSPHSKQHRHVRKMLSLIVLCVFSLASANANGYGHGPAIVSVPLKPIYAPAYIPTTVKIGESHHAYKVPEHRFTSTEYETPGKSP
jgi:hypothetical protein